MRLAATFRCGPQCAPSNCGPCAPNAILANLVFQDASLALLEYASSKNLHFSLLLMRTTCPAQPCQAQPSPYDGGGIVPCGSGNCGAAPSSSLLWKFKAIELGDDCVVDLCSGCSRICNSWISLSNLDRHYSAQRVRKRSRQSEATARCRVYSL